MPLTVAGALFGVRGTSAASIAASALLALRASRIFRAEEVDGAADISATSVAN